MKTSESKHTKLPKGQIERMDFPRFGVWDYADFEAPVSEDYSLQLAGDINPITINQSDLATLERVEQVSDFHCVTTWTYRNVHWSGYRFQDVYEQIIRPQLPSGMTIKLVALRGMDRYKATLPLDDILANDVLLADRLDNKPLPAKHGAPLRLVAPAHYGYKNIKHLQKIEFWQDENSYRTIPIFRLMMHPRARIAHEERARLLPGWVYRYLYRPLINFTVHKMNPQK